MFKQPRGGMSIRSFHLGTPRRHGVEGIADQIQRNKMTPNSSNRNSANGISQKKILFVAGALLVLFVFFRQ